ncbi:MAG: hypothetical protein RIC19_19110 [Phaeodactylibacter sp.]|uniref:hypothetical protein n=1 Tax=Phaeodactylibacter sp. TaxID=1940289 RepID=UPI0032EFBF74
MLKVQYATAISGINVFTMLKLLFTGLIIYAAYKYFFGSNAIGGGQSNDRDQIRYDDHQKKPRKDDNDDEYIDYEEVD